MPRKAKTLLPLTDAERARQIAEFEAVFHFDTDTTMETEEKEFTCKACKHELPVSYSLRTEGYCYLCDPNITVAELLSDEPISRTPATV